MTLEVTVTGAAELGEFINKLPEHLVNVVSASLLAIGEHASSRAVQNAPIKTGDLRASVRPTKPTVSGNRVTVNIVSDIPYALRMHEDFYNLGPLSAQQPQPKEGFVGRKFIQRVIDFHLPVYEQSLADNVQNNLAGAVQAKIKVTRIPS